MTTIKSYGDKVQLVYPDMRRSHMIFVEKLVDGVWTKVRSFDRMSDDYAYTNAAEFAEKLRKEMQ